MAYFDTLSKKQADAGQDVGRQAKTMNEISSLNSLISDNRKGISRYCFELGKAYYQAHADEENCEFPELIDRIRELLSSIEEAEEAIKRLKGITKCPDCGADVSAQAAFCSNCGRPMASAAAKTHRCHGCGREVPEGSSFCVYCGTKLTG